MSGASAFADAALIFVVFLILGGLSVLVLAFFGWLPPPVKAPPAAAEKRPAPTGTASRL